MEVGPSVIESLPAAMLSKRRFGLFDEARPIVGLASGVDALDQKLELLTRPPVTADGRIAMHPRDIVAEAERLRSFGPNEMTERFRTLLQGAVTLVDDLAKTGMLEHLAVAALRLPVGLATPTTHD